VKCLLGANVLSDFVRGEPNVAARLKSEAPNVLSISVITELEVEYGLSRAPRLKPEIGAAMRALVDAVTVFSFEPEDARAAARLRASLAGHGNPIGAYDLLLAATALRRGLTLVTHNVREFARVSGLGVQDWREA
jgi:tRNA(fMet)-specific endonuclease VapC